jgi:hypothetical protein
MAAMNNMGVATGAQQSLSVLPRALLPYPAALPAFCLFSLSGPELSNPWRIAK